MSQRFILACLLGFSLCEACSRPEKQLLGKIKRESIALSPKVTGRILHIYITEGDVVKPGDTLAMLDVPEAHARMQQAEGAVTASSAQHLLADNGYTQNQLRQLRAKYAAAKQQYDLAAKSFERADAIFKDSLMSPQAHDESLTRLRVAQAQLDAATAELNEAETGTRYETRLATLGQQRQAQGALQETQIAYSERYILATNYMTIETIALHQGELAAAGYPVFSGYITNSTWFRFTVPESRIAPFRKGQRLSIEVPYNQRQYLGKLLTIKQMPRYADITTAYPDYELDDAVYELKIAPLDQLTTDSLLYNATIRLAVKSDKP